jgi:hypothetical protein
VDKVRGKYRRTDGWEGFMKNTVEMGSSIVIWMQSFIKIGSGRLMTGGHSLQIE